MSKDNGGPDSDRELLEMAAKAAGITSVGYGRNGIATGRNGSCLVGYWNPLTDDGDALRLAVKLNINITHSAFGVDATKTGSEISFEGWGADRLSATRRAIVRAAAAIGSAM